MTAPTTVATQAVDEPSTAARLCWHAAAICRALDEALRELQRAAQDLTDHTDAILEIAIALDGAEADAPPDSSPHARTRPTDPPEDLAHTTPQQRQTHLHHGAGDHADGPRNPACGARRC